MDRTALLDAMDQWTFEERLAFIGDAWDRLAGAGCTPDAEQWHEIERRLDAHEKDPTNVVTWEQVEARIRSGS